MFLILEYVCKIRLLLYSCMLDSFCNYSRPAPIVHNSSFLCFALCLLSHPKTSHFLLSLSGFSYNKCFFFLSQLLASSSLSPHLLIFFFQFWNLMEVLLQYKSCMWPPTPTTTTIHPNMPLSFIYIYMYLFSSNPKPQSLKQTTTTTTN